MIKYPVHIMVDLAKFLTQILQICLVESNVKSNRPNTKKIVHSNLPCLPAVELIPTL